MNLKKKRFIVINEGFVCEQCGKDVLPTVHDHPRNHCPFCLFSKHVDINPGDRENMCRGKMKPIGIISGGKHEYTIVHECINCHKRIPSPAILKSEVQKDSTDLIITLSANPIKD